MNKPLLIAALTLATLAQPAFAETHDAHSGHGAPAAPAAHATSPYVQEVEAANKKMHTDMAIALSGDADVDFIKGMIPHHQGAIDMAKIQLKYGKDEQAGKLAKDIIAAQEKEIAWMKEWLAKKGVK